MMDAELEFLYLSILIQGYTEKLRQHDRMVVNYCSKIKYAYYIFK